MLSVVVPSAVFAALAALVAWSLGAPVWGVAVVYVISGIVGVFGTALVFMQMSNNKTARMTQQNSHITT